MEKLIEYIETNIFPIYQKNDKAHDLTHIKKVIENSLELAEKLKLNKKLLYTIAAYHDTGHHIDAENHEKVSAEIFKKDQKMKEFFNEEELEIIHQAILDHRSSNKEKPKTIYGEVICSADKSQDIYDFIERAINYGLHHFPSMTKEEQINRAYDHLNNKFGEKGYSTVYFETKSHKKNKKEFKKLLENKNKFFEIATKIIENQ